MLKGLIVAGAIVLVWAVGALMLLQSRRPRSALNLMAISFTPALPLFVLVYGLTPPTLGFLPAQLSATPRALALLDGVLVLFLFFGTCVQVYYHFHNSITLRLLAEFTRAAREALTTAQIEARFGVEALLDERLQTLGQARLMCHREDRYFPTALGLLTAAVARATRAVLRVKP